MKKYLVLFILLLIIPVQAQEAECRFPDITAVNCADLGPNEICFGQGSVELLVDCAPAPEFDEAGERIDLADVCFMRTSGAGVALANLTPADDGVFFAVFGDVEMQAVSGGDVGLPAQLLEDADLHSGPGSQYSIVGTLPAGTEVFVNACNCTGNWLRVMQEDGSVAWIPTRRVDVDESLLPRTTVDTPVYENLQSFTLVTSSPCSGVLIQMLADPVQLQINGVQVELDSTAFIRSMPGGEMEIDVLEGQARIATEDMTVHVPAGGHVLIPLSEQDIPSGEMVVELYAPDHVVALPLGLLPQAVDPVSVLDATHPTIVGVEECSVISDLGEVPCPLQFINPDGDEIVAMDVEFIYAPVGDWEGSRHEVPALLSGDMNAGTLGWDVSCSLVGENFIGPVEWWITLEDAAGNRSEPFRAAFNCVDG